MIPRSRGNRRRGLTLVELIVAFTILLILSTMALPVAKVKVHRDKERRLREALYEMRQAIDRYKDASDEGLLGQVDPDNHGYPPSLEVLVEGVETAGPGALGANGTGGFPGQPGANQNDPRARQSRGSFGSSSRNNQRGGSFGSSSRQSGSRNSGSGFGSRGSGSGFGSRGMGSDFGDDEDEEPKTMRFLRSIPVDPMTGRAEWGMRSVSDPPNAMSWGGDNVFDVYSFSMDSSLDGELYSEW